MRFALLALFLAAPAFAQTAPVVDPAAALQQRLDRPLSLQLGTLPLPDALRKIEDATGVPVRVGERVYDALPYGPQTPVTADLRDVPARAALAALADALGLKLEAASDHAELVPGDALQRLGRRATTQELRLLARLATTPLAGLDGRASARTLVDAIDRQLAGVADGPPAGLVDFRPASEAAEAQSVLVPRGRTLGGALDDLARQSDLAWYPWGGGVVVLPRADAYRLLLDRPIAARYDGVELGQVLLDLAQRTGVPFVFQPGVLQRVAPEFRTVTLVVDAPARQALENLAGKTGLGYVVNDAGVYLWYDTTFEAGGNVVALVPGPGGALLPVRPDDLPEEARAKLEEQRRAAVERVRASVGN